MKTPPRADFAAHMARLCLLGGLPAVGLGAMLAARVGSPMAWSLLVLAIVGWGLSARAIHAATSHVLNTIANLVSAIHEGDFSVRGKSGRSEEDVGFAFAAINSLAEVLREQRHSALEATALLRKVMEAIDAAILAFDEAQLLCLINPAGERLLGLHAERLLGQSAEKLGLSAWLSGDAPRKIAIGLPGRRGPWELRRQIFRQAGRRHVLVVVSDVSRLVREEERHAWKDIIRVLSHEIHNSLAPIASIADGLQTTIERRGSDVLDDVREGLLVISRRSESLRRFMEGYGRLARLPPPEYGAIHIDSWIRRIAVLESRVPLALSGPRSAVLEGDEGLLDQALINLVRNAADASVASGATVGIEWQIDERGEASITVVDSGPGLAGESALFVPFFTTKPAGTGIGLVLSREIIESHEGRLTLENRKDGPGCIARVVLPRARISCA